MSIRVGIMGYGNLGRGIECALKQNSDMELVAVFSRRNPESVQITIVSKNTPMDAITPCSQGCFASAAAADMVIVP